jgi:hypothetical protein
VQVYKESTAKAGGGEEHVGVFQNYPGSAPSASQRELAPFFYIPPIIPALEQLFESSLGDVRIFCICYSLFCFFLSDFLLQRIFGFCGF